MALHVAVLPLVENIAPCTKGGEDGEGPAPEMSRGGYGGGPQPEAAQRLALGDAEPGTRAEQIHNLRLPVVYILRILRILRLHLKKRPQSRFLTT